MYSIEVVLDDLFLWQGILEHDLFQRSLVACCLEMVIFSHQPPGSFPLVIDIFSLAPYDFYKVTSTQNTCSTCHTVL